MPLFSGLFKSGDQRSDAEEAPKLFPAESFAILQAEVEGRAVLGSVNKGYKKYSRKAEFPWSLHIGIALTEGTLQQNGLPDNDETNVAYEVEDELLAAIKKIHTAHYVGHVFNDGFLDVYVYLPEPKNVHEYLQGRIAGSDLKRGIGYEIHNDPTWERVAMFLE